MIDIAPLTAEEFSRWEDDDGDGHRWAELAAGKIVRFAPPDPEHGRIVLNISKSLAEHLQNLGASAEGYACFELGLIIARDPDTVRRPAISYFSGGPRFAELENVITETRPQLVVEVASSSERRRNAAERIESYLEWGVRTVWLADPLEKQMHVIEQKRNPKLLSEDQSLDGGPAIPDFRMKVADVFHQPGW
jgi:Uma2 family endonuclease